jgi:hypothetical protein
MTPALCLLIITRTKVRVHYFVSTEKCYIAQIMEQTRIEQLLDELQSAAQKRGLSKRALAQAARLHPNTLRNFGASRASSARGQAWRPSVRVIAKLEPILLPGEPPEGRQPPVTTKMGKNANL